MTQEEFEAKVQSMPYELQNQFRQSLEISLSKRIVNRFMSTVMQAYAWGQRTAWGQQAEAAQKTTEDGAYMHGMEDMLEALKTVSDMTPNEISQYFQIDRYSHLDGLYAVLRGNAGEIMEKVGKYRNDQMQEKDEREKASVQAMADTIGIVRLCEIAEGIRREKAEKSGLPF